MWFKSNSPVGTLFNGNIQQLSSMAERHVHSLRRAEVDAGYCSIETVSIPSDNHEYNEDRVTWLFTPYGVIIAVFDGLCGL